MDYLVKLYSKKNDGYYSYAVDVDTPQNAADEAIKFYSTYGNSISDIVVKSITHTQPALEWMLEPTNDTPYVISHPVYCTRTINYGDNCKNCSTSNYGRDCNNNNIQ